MYPNHLDAPHFLSWGDYRKGTLRAFGKKNLVSIWWFFAVYIANCIHGFKNDPERSFTTFANQMRLLKQNILVFITNWNNVLPPVLKQRFTACIHPNEFDASYFLAWDDQHKGTHRDFGKKNLVFIMWFFAVYTAKCLDRFTNEPKRSFTSFEKQVRRLKIERSRVYNQLQTEIHIEQRMSRSSKLNLAYEHIM